MNPTELVVRPDQPPLQPWARALDNLILGLAPAWGLQRIRARVLARHYEAASGSRRTTGWMRSGADANAENQAAISVLRAHARDLVRNNAWGRNALRVIARNTVGWGIQPTADDPAEAVRLAPLWKQWAGTTECDADRRLTFSGMQALVMRCVAESGEVLVRRRRRRLEDGLAIPLQLQVLEPDFLDQTRDQETGIQGGPIIQGIEFDAIGRRVAYWLFDTHPGSRMVQSLTSRRIPAEDVIHVYALDRAGQVRGVSWFAAAIVNLKDFDEWEDASLLRQKIAACFAAFVSDTDGADVPVGEVKASDPTIETLEPGLISNLPPGKSITFADPPATVDEGFSIRALRRIAAAFGVTYEDLTGDYSGVNFSSARMARIAHWANVHEWRWNMLVPQFCDPAWAWALEAAAIAGGVGAVVPATWTPPPMPMLEPDKEGLAYQRLVRNGAMTHDEMVREQGSDPERHWAEYAACLKRLDALGITLDSDARKTTQAGLEQATDPAAAQGETAGGAAAA